MKAKSIVTSIFLGMIQMKKEEDRWYTIDEVADRVKLPEFKVRRSYSHVEYLSWKNTKPLISQRGGRGNKIQMMKIANKSPSDILFLAKAKDRWRREASIKQNKTVKKMGTASQLELNWGINLPAIGEGNNG